MFPREGIRAGAGGDTRPHTINQAKKYKDKAFNNKGKKYDVKKWDIGKFFKLK